MTDEDRARARRVRSKLRERGLFERADKIARAHFVLLDDTIGFSRRAPIVRARHAIWRTLHDDCELSWPAVAEIFERRHDSVIQARTNVKMRRQTGLESDVVGRIVDYVRNLGFAVLADEIAAGEWRSEADRCKGALSCPHRGLSRYEQRCFLHREKPERAG